LQELPEPLLGYAAYRTWLAPPPAGIGGGRPQVCTSLITPLSMLSHAMSSSLLLLLR
jgi:hypothetical protein